MCLMFNVRRRDVFKIGRRRGAMEEVGVVASNSANPSLNPAEVHSCYYHVEYVKINRRRIGPGIRDKLL